MSPLGERIRELRTNKHLKQSELGKILNVSKVSVSGYENNTREPDQSTIIKLADFFNVSTDYLFGRELQNINLIRNLNEDIEKLPHSQQQEIIAFIKFKIAMFNNKFKSKWWIAILIRTISKNINGSPITINV